MEKAKVVKNREYKNLLEELKSIITSSKYKAYKAVDNIKVQTYWQIGERIVREELKYKDRADYGKYLIDNLAIDLEVEKRLIYRTVQFYKFYPIVSTVSTQLSWSHYVELIEINNQKERKFYETKIITSSWSIRELRLQIKNKLYQKTDNKEIENILKTILPKVVNIQKIFKPEYDLNFLAITPTHLEKELETKIISDIEKFLKELGSDFSFLERQMPILIDDQKHFIDLVLFHRGVPCVVLVDLKIGKLDSGDIGQMNKYVSYYRNNRQYASEQDAIGLIICREMGHEEVVYALGDLEEKIFVAKYKVKLPSEDKIRKLIRAL